MWLSAYPMGWAKISEGALPVQSLRAPDPQVARLIGARIRKAREDRGLSQAALADVLGLSQAAMSTIESGARPLRVDELMVVSRVTGRDLDFFVPKSAQGPIGVSLRAEVAQLPVPEYRAAVLSFLEDVGELSMPEPTTTVHESDPERAAERLLKVAGVTSPPVNVRSLAGQLGVAVFPRSFPDALSALFARHGERALIGVNEVHPDVRQRFSIAHELGHFVLHHDSQHIIELEPQSAGDPPGYDWQKERQANTFAAAVLMPSEWIRADAKSYSATRLATRYKVSPAAMAYRLANLRLAPSA
jgi:Zn-dependent peptidase ImmA (M78 family)/transcriptional regulator with XRE-family HTH domain